MSATATARDPACQIACPKCRAERGAKCVNYLGKGKSTCKERVDAWSGDPLNIGPGIAIREEQPGPMVCKPLGSISLVEIDGFPDGVGGHLLNVGCNTLFDLEKRVAKQSKAHSSQEAKVFAAFRSIPGIAPSSAVAACDAVMEHLNVGAAMPAPVEPKPKVKVTKVMLANGPATIVSHPDAPVPGTPIAAPKPVTDFDESTPPPRTRPKGSPLPLCVRIPPGGVESEYAAWEKQGRVPEGAFLSRFVGMLDSPSGYMRDGKPLPVEQLCRLKLVAATIEEGVGGRFVVFAPEV